MSDENLLIKENKVLKNPKELIISLTALAGVLCCLLPSVVTVISAIPKGSTCQNGILKTDLGMFGSSELSVDSKGDIKFDTPNPGWNIRVGSYTHYYGFRPVIVFDKTDNKWILTYMLDTPGRSYGDLKHGMELSYEDELEKCSGVDLD